MGHTPAAPGFAASFDDGEVFASGNGQVRAQAYIAGLMERGFVEQPRLLAITRSDGSARVADLWARPIHAPDGEIEFVVLVASDQTESHTLRIMADAANNRLLVANERLSEIVSHMPCGLIAFDGRGLMLAANQMVKDMLDMPATLFTQPKVWWDDLTRFQAVRGEYGDGDVEAIVTSRRDILHSNRPRRYERQRVNGHVYEVSSAPLARGGIVTTYTDITERKANEAQIRQLAFYDALTGLPNRRLLLDRVGQALQAAVRNHWFGAVFFLDLDQFKNLNDTRGHDAGDALLKLMGERLAGAVRSVDTVSRMGGDEFVVLMERLGNSDAEAIQAARRIAAKVHGVLMEPYVLGGDTYSCTCSIGIALLGDASESVEAILKQADIALYQAKDAGRNAIRFFDHTMQAAVVGRAELEAGLRLALARQEFVLYYQPQIDRHGRVFGVETLLRWVRPAAPAVSPGVFIGVAEACGVIVPIGLWVFEQVCAQVAAWAEVPHMAGLRVSVNLSARQLQEPDVVEAFAARLQSSGVDPQRIAVELTESLFIGEHGDVLHKLHALKALGLHLSMDDFGTGYSSLSQLHRLPLDEIKIDQAFVRDIESDPGDAAVVRAVIAMGLALGLDVVAEGVETEGQRRYLAEQGATSYQGYLFGYPMAGQDIERWLEQPPVFWPGMLS
jgi:diguanylate cyclase (GGDEF)-like protein